MKEQKEVHLSLTLNHPQQVEVIKILQAANFLVNDEAVLSIDVMVRYMEPKEINCRVAPG